MELKEFINNIDYNGCTHTFKHNSNIAIVTQCCNEKTTEQEPVYAYNRYVGREFSIVKSIRDKILCDLYICSAKYGIISYEDKIPYYNQTFNDLKHSDILNAGKALNIPDDFNKILHQGYSIIILIVGENYKEAMDLQNLSLPTNTCIIGFGLNTFSYPNILSVDQPIPYLREVYGCFSLCVKATVISKYFETYTSDELVKNPSSLFDDISKRIKRFENPKRLF